MFEWLTITEFWTLYAFKYGSYTEVTKDNPRPLSNREAKALAEGLEDPNQEG